MRTVEERLAGLEGRVNEQSQIFGTLRDTLARLEQRVDGRFDAIDRRFDAIDHQFDEIDRRFEGVDRRFEGFDRRFDELDRKLSKQFALVMSMLMTVIAAFVGSVITVAVM